MSAQNYCSVLYLNNIKYSRVKERDYKLHVDMYAYSSVQTASGRESTCIIIHYSKRPMTAQPPYLRFTEVAIQKRWFTLPLSFGPC